MFAIRAPRAETGNRNIWTIRLNGANLDRRRLKTAEISVGGTLELD